MKSPALAANTKALWGSLAHQAHRLVTRIAREEDKVGFFTSQFLWSTGLCRVIVFAMPDGYKLRFYPSSCSTAYWLDRNFRDGDSRLLRHFLSAGQTFVDIGANIGHLSLLAATRVGLTGRVVAVEAHPRTYRFLAGNVTLNGFPIETHNVAISDQPGALRFTSLHSDDQNRALPDPGQPGQRDRVTAVTLDELLRGARVDLLKIDTEGFELRVLEGASETLKRCAAIYIEDSERNLRRYGGSSGQLRQKLYDSGFLPFRIRGNQAFAVPATTASPAGSAANLFAVNEGMADHLLARAGLTRLD